MKWYAPIGLAALYLLLVAGCNVQEEQEARLPDADVDVDVQGGRWPEYDVNWADVDVGTEERTITVPVIRVEEETRQVTVPYVRVTPPAGAASEERTVSVEFDVPHAGYTLQIVEVRASDDDLWVIARLDESQGAAAQMITRVSDQVVIDAPATLDIRKVVIGTRPPAAGSEVQFVDSMATLDNRIPANARALYRRST